MECERPVSGVSLQEKSACGGGEFSTVELAAPFLIHMIYTFHRHMLTGVTAQRALSHNSSFTARARCMPMTHVHLVRFMHLALWDVWRFTDSETAQNPMTPHSLKCQTRHAVSCDPVNWGYVERSACRARPSRPQPPPPPQMSHHLRLVPPPHLVQLEKGVGVVRDARVLKVVAHPQTDAREAAKKFCCLL